MRKSLLTYLFFLLFFGFGNCQTQKQQFSSIEDKLSFYLLDVEDGLSSDFIYSIEQDSLGFIWIGTQEGLNRYDGTQFKVYKKGDLAYNKNISDDFIYQIRAIDHGKLLINTAEGINIYRAKSETFEVLNARNGLLSNYINYFSYGHDEMILGLKSGIKRINDQINLELKNNHLGKGTSFSSNDITSLEKQGDSLIWIGTDRYGLYKLNYKTRSVSHVKLRDHINSHSLQIITLYTTGDGGLWIGTDEGIYVITATNNILQLKKSFVEGEGLSDDKILCFEEDNTGQLWIGTRNGGLNIINKSDFLQQKSDLYVKWYLPKDDGSSVYNRTVSALKMDRDDNMWIGTSTGLNFVSIKGEPIKLLRKNLFNSNGLSHDRIGALSESYDGKIWIGTDGSGLDLLNPNNGEFKHYQHQNNNPFSLSNDYIISLYEDKKKRLWIGTYQGGLNRMDTATGECRHYLEGEMEDGSDVRVIFEDSKKQIWVGTNRGGLYKYIEKTDQFEFISSLGKIDIRNIREDYKGDFWLATYGDGILRYTPNTSEAIFYNSTTVKGFKTDIVFCVQPLSNGDVLAGTLNQGLIRLNPTRKSIITLTEKNGLSNNTVSSMTVENENNIWLGTFKGISHYNPLTNKIYNLNTYSNIQQGMFNIGSSIITKSGVVYLGGDKGLNIFNPNNLHVKKETYPVVFEKLEVLDKKASVSKDNGSGVLDKSILYEDHIILNYDQTFFSIDYAALKYPFVKSINYSYRIDGYNKNWINTNTAGKVNVINLPHGDYTLNVKAKFGSGNEVIKQMHITIKPPIWKTPIAYVFYILVLIVAIYGVVKYYSERIKLINSLLFEKKQRQLEHDFNEERIRFFTSFSHELRTPLTLILAPLEDLIEHTSILKHKNSLKLIYKNAKQLLQSINRLLEFRKSNLGLSKLMVGKHNLSECLEQWVYNYFPLAKKRDIALSYEIPEETLIAWLDIEKMHTIFNNILSNAFKYTKDKGEIHVSLSFDEESFEIKVKDTGYGIKAEEIEHVFERYYQSNSTNNKNGLGIGLALSKSFAELHMGTIKIESELNKGSVFSVIIPRDKSLFVNSVTQNYDLDQDIEDNDFDVITEYKSLKDKPSNINLKETRELILLIDDNQDVLSYLDGLLENKYDLIYAKDGEEGVEKALRYIPDLIVSDVMMPIMNGIELCNTLKVNVETSHIPIILLTAKGNVESIQEGYTHGADDYIIKPFSSKILQTRIRNLLDIRSQLRNAFLNKEESKLEKLSKDSKILDKEKSFLSQLENIILKNLDQEKLDVSMVADDIGMSRSSLFRKIKAVTGLNINQYIRKVKMDKAAELLKTGNYTIAQVSYEVGFNNVKYFRKLFKEQFDNLPSEFTNK
ncbi:hybrid sensor histidine kinase/response regulator [Confluentibacter sediminis]|uniref:hybrid sensor histidine kinase/response regulator n=1 Tax=Confluentibacter sediminis TaxID=2219045 RepID=UPI0013A6AAC1|nr:two-component regulator propeller domain-containing protein [Confluentibacter sediminis]